MPKARLVFDGDNIYTEKDARIYKLKSDISTKIDGIPGVVDSLDSTSATDALSANMGRALQDQINWLSWTWKFLSTWDCTTWLPGTNPQEDPYTYKVWDYYVVSAVWATNYKPHWGTYTQWVPSTTVETENVWINDKYYFDWADWVRIPNTSIQISIDTALSTTSTNAVENRAIANAVNAKQDIISDLSTIRTWAGKWATALQPNDNISQLTNNVGYQTAGDVASAIAWKQDILSAWDWISITSNTVTNTKPWPTISGTAPANPTEWILWYDSTNDVLKVYDGSVWQEVGSDAADINTKTFYLSSSSDLTTAQAVYDWYIAGKNPIVIYDDKSYTLSTVTAGWITFESIEVLWDVISNEHTRIWRKTIVLSVTSWSVTSISTQWRTTIANVLATNQDYSSPYVPQYNGSPATKKYVDDSVDSVIPSWSTAPQNPQEWDLWYDTVNDKLMVYDWTNWVEVWSDAADINTKTFYLSSTSDLTNAQAAYDWYYAGKNPIVIYNDKAYVLHSSDSVSLMFMWGVWSELNANSTTKIGNKTILFSISSWNVTSITEWINNSNNVLKTDVNYSIPYTPAYDWSPATKKYVDDSVAWVMTTDSTAPLDPEIWQLWYDTTNWILYVYNWVEWMGIATMSGIITWTTFGTFAKLCYNIWPAHTTTLNKYYKASWSQMVSDRWTATYTMQWIGFFTWMWWSANSWTISITVNWLTIWSEANSSWNYSMKYLNTPITLSPGDEVSITMSQYGNWDIYANISDFY